MRQTDTVARAFELARGGECESVDDVRQQLKVEAFAAVDAHLAGPTLARQLKQAIKDGAA